MSKSMKYRPTVLNIFSVILIIWINYDFWTDNPAADVEGWGKLALLTFTGAGILGLLIDLGLQSFLKNYKLVNAIEFFIVGSLLIYTWLN